jgi:uncharacterized protein (TIGR02145 family)
MKTLTLVVSFLIAISNIQGQDYQISFTASGHSSTIDSIHVENLSQGTTAKLNGNDILHLVETLGLNTLIDDENSVKVYPNPMIKSTFVEFINQNPQTISMEVFNELNTLIVKKDVMVQNGLQRFEISGLNAGIYTLVVSSKEWIYSAKIISLGEKSKNANIKKQSVDLGSTHERVVESTKDLVEMQYNDGEIVLFKGFSGNYARVLTLLPTQSQAVDFEFIPCSDEDGNNYAVVTIGNQTWMAENLKTSKYSDGNDIPLITDGNTWGTLSSPAYCWYLNDIANKPTYGALYNWYTVETGMLCPIGWHVPSDSELYTLIDNAGGSDVAGGKLKSTRTEPEAHPRWNSPNTGAANEYGFSALPGSYRNSGSGGFSGLGNWGNWWSNTVDVPGFAFSWRMRYSNELATHEWGLKVYGYSVRCVKD